MAQTGYTPILIYSSSTGGNAPAAGSLTNSTLGSELAINITDGKLFYKDNANAVQVIGWKTTPTTAGGTGLTSYTAGDLLYYATGTTLSKLAIGASTTILTSSGTAPQWSAASGITVGKATNLDGGAAGSVPYQTGAGATSFVSIGTAYYQLGVNAGGTAPAWQPSATSVLTTQGDLLYASAANTLARLAKNTTATRYLSNTGSSNNPAWAQIDLTNGVTGTLPTGNGGTGLTSFTANGILYATSTSALTTGSALTFDGSLVVPQAAIGTSGTVGFRANDTTNSKNIQMFRAGSGYNYLGIVGTQGVIYSIDQLTIAMDTNGPLQLSLGGAVRWTYDSTGNVAVNTAAKGINFTANSAAAGMTSQLLNWYEEGTFTAGLTCGSGSVTLKTANNTCAYTRIGRQVTITGYLEIDTATTPSGTLLLTGLPYTIKNANSAYPTGIPYFSVTGAITGTPVMLGYTNTTTVSFRRMSGGTGIDDLAGVLGAGSQIIFTFVYIV